MEEKILLVSNDAQSMVSTLVKQVMPDFGSIKIIDETALGHETLPSSYHIVLLDASTVDGLVAAVQHIKDYNLSDDRVVLSIMPSWDETRAALRAGATDYLHYSQMKEELVQLGARLMLHPGPENHFHLR